MVMSVNKAPSHLYRRGNSFYFRMLIPAGLRPCLGMHEFRKSLGCVPLREARRMVSRLEGVAVGLLEGLKGGRVLEELSDAQIRAIVARRFKEALDTDEFHRFDAYERKRESVDFEAEIDGETEALDLLEGDLTRSLAQGDLAPVYPAVREIMKEEELSLKEGSPTWTLLAREVMRATLKALQVGLERRKGIYTPDQEVWGFQEALKALGELLPETGATDNGLTSTVSLGEARERYFEEARRLERWATEKTRKENETAVGQFVEILGDRIPSGRLSKEHIRKFKNALMHLPKNAKKVKEYRDKTLEELLRLDIPKENLLSNTTLNHRAVRINAFLNWGASEGLFEGEGLSSVLSFKADTDSRKPFTMGDLSKLFNPDSYLDATRLHGAFFWVPIIAYFTGMRIEEICQLFVNDIREVDGVWCFDINDMGEGEVNKRVKTKASKRLVPIHPYLAEDLGFLRYVDEAGKTRETVLFPCLKVVSGKRSHGMVQWFGRYKRKLGFTGEKTFHSFRHTLPTLAKQHMVPVELVGDLIGHGHPSITYGLYGKTQAPPKALLEEVVLKIHFEVDLENLKRSPHARPLVREQGYPATAILKERENNERNRKGKAGRKSNKTGDKGKR